MEILYLSREIADEENIMKIIDFIRACEKENNLSNEEIDYKYTHGYCGELARLIKTIFEKCLDKKIYIKTFNTALELKDEVVYNTHLYVSPQVKCEKRAEHKSAKDLLTRYYFDIFGKKTETEVEEFLSSDYYLYENPQFYQLFDKEYDYESFKQIKQLALKYIKPIDSEKQRGE